MQPNATPHIHWPYHTQICVGATGIVQQLSQKSQQRPAFVILGMAAVAFLLVLVIFGVEVMSNLFAFLPIYESIKAVLSDNKQDDTQWLTYWITVASFNVAESVFFALTFDPEVGRITTMMFLYFLARTAFLAWCAHAKVGIILLSAVVTSLYLFFPCWSYSKSFWFLSLILPHSI